MGTGWRASFGVMLYPIGEVFALADGIFQLQDIKSLSSLPRVGMCIDLFANCPCNKKGKKTPREQRAECDGSSNLQLGALQGLLQVVLRGPYGARDQP